MLRGGRGTAGGGSRWGMFVSWGGGMVVNMMRAQRQEAMLISPVWSTTTKKSFSALRSHRTRAKVSFPLTGL